MENEDIIKLAVRLTEENNSLYKQSAREQAFMIKAKDNAGTVDTFITVKSSYTADDWKRKFESANFTDVVVSPFRTAGNLAYDDVDDKFFNAVSERAKWQMEHSPEGFNTPLTPYNPYAGKDVGLDDTDVRITGASYTYNSANEYQEYILEKLKTDQDKIFAGWYKGSLIDWVNKIASLSTNIKDALEVEYPNLQSSPQLQHYFDQVRRRNPEYDLKTYKPEKYDIKFYNIDMVKLSDILASSSVDLDEFPESRITPVLDTIIKTANEHKFHKQYTQSDMNKFQNDEIDNQLEKDVKTWNLIKKVLRGISR